MKKVKSGSYVDGFVLVVPKNKLATYKKIATAASKVWQKYGAIDYKECVLDDAQPEHVVLTFPKLAKAKKGEVVIFSYITYKSRAHRDSVNAKVMKDPFMQTAPTDMPFDMDRMTFGGFKVLVDLG